MVANWIDSGSSRRAGAGQVAHLQLEGVDTTYWPTVRGFTDTSYMVAFPGGRVVACATREPTAGFDVRVTAQAIDDVLNGALRIAPGLGQATFFEARVGLRPVVRDGLPVIGRWPGLNGIFVCTGHGAYGLLMGPRSAAAISEVMLGQPRIPSQRGYYARIEGQIGLPAAVVGRAGDDQVYTAVQRHPCA